MMRFAPIFLASTFLSIHFGTVLYVHSSLLGKFFEPDIVSLLFLIGAVSNIILFLFTPKLIERFGKRWLLFFFLLIALFSTFGLAMAEVGSVVLVSFLVYESVIFMIYYCLDIFLEELSIDTRTGEIRGLYLTFVSIGIALGPFILSMLEVKESLKPAYIVASLLLLPTILLNVFAFKSHQPKWHGLHHKHALLPFKMWWQTKSVRQVTLAKLVLEFFFAFMIIYTPVYLYNIIGFEWKEIGTMFTVMLLPFVLFEWPAGEIADRLTGEKEIMSIGFLIMGASLFIMPFIGKVFFVWMAILFISRVGASLVEAMTDSYFFKHIEAKDTRLLSIFRLTRPIGIILGTMVGALTLNLFSFDKIFFVLAVVVFFGLRESLNLRDTL